MLALGFAACAPQKAPSPPESPPAPAVTTAPESAIADAGAPSPAPLAAAGDAGPHDGGREAKPDADIIGETLALQAKLLVVDAVVGTGKEAHDGDHVSVQCVGTLADGTVFETSRAKGKKPLQFVVGGDSVVMGLAEGVAGMRVGGRRTLTVPPALGYGSRGKGKKVPPGATLTFDVELLSVK